MSLFFTLIGVFFLLSGIGVTYGGYKSRNKALNAFEWPKAKAELEQVDYHRVQKGLDDPNVEYMYDLKFRYSYQGKDYVGEKFSPIHPMSRKKEEKVKEDILGYQPGDQVKVIVNPENPAESYLELPSKEEAKKHGRKGLIVGTVLSLASVALIAIGTGTGIGWPMVVEVMKLIGFR